MNGVQNGAEHTSVWGSGIKANAVESRVEVYEEESVVGELHVGQGYVKS